MNEVSNFDTNVWDDKLNCPENKWDDPPYETSASEIYITSIYEPLNCLFLG